MIENVIADVTARCDIRRASDIGDYLLSKLLPGDGKAKPLPPFNSVVPADTSQPDAPPTKTSKQAADIVTDVEDNCFCQAIEDVTAEEEDEDEDEDEEEEDVTARCDIRRASDFGDYLLSNLLPGDGKSKPLPPFNSVVPADTSQPDAPPTKTSKQAADIVTVVEDKCFCQAIEDVTAEEEEEEEEEEEDAAAEEEEEEEEDATSRFDIRRASDIGDYLLSNLPPSDCKAKPLPPFNTVVPADTSQPDAPPTKTSKQAADIGTDVEAECLFVNWA